MIDIHLHILPGVDDGPRTLEESLDLARLLVREGIHSAIATPHYNDIFPRYSAAEVRNKVNDLQQELNCNGIPLRLFAGHEALIKPGLIADIQAGRLATLNGSRYLLLELWNSVWPPETEQVIFELRAFGIVPIIAHPERYQMIQRYPDRLTTLLNYGVLIQLTANSLVGAWGKTTCRTAKILLKKGLVHCIASDAHGIQKRSPNITRALDHAAQLLDLTRINQMMEILPTAIINDEIYKIE